MKFGKIFLAFGIGLLIFTGILTTESARYGIISQIQDPFEKTEKLEKRVAVSTFEDPQDFFTPDGEFLRVFPEAEINFSGTRRELIRGDLFLSSDFISESKDVNINFSSVVSAPLIGQLKVGKLLINAPGASVFVSYKHEDEKIEIYAFNHSIEILWEGAKMPFLIPQGMKVSIAEKFISEKTGSLFYTKLKKDFRLKPFEVNFPPNESGEKVEDKIGLAVLTHAEWGDRMKAFAMLEPSSWFFARPDHLTGKAISFVKTTAFGLPKSKHDKIQFQTLVAPFVTAHHAVKENSILKAENSLREFKAISDGAEWKKLLKGNPNINEKWNRFIRAQKAWMATMFPSDPAYIFVKILESKTEKNIFAEIENEFSRIEILIANRHLEEAKKRLIDLKKKTQSAPKNKVYRPQITKIRRALGEVLNTKIFFQSEDIFQLYALLIENESVGIDTKDRELSDELALEAAQDLLSFLDNFLRNHPNPKVSKILLGVYQKLDVETVAQRRGRKDLFSKEEKETIAFIKLVGNSGLTKEEIESIKEQQAYQSELTAKIDKLKKIDEKEDEETRIKIETTEALKEFISSLDVDTSAMKVTVLKPKEYFQFQGGRFMGEPVSGTFRIAGQIFKTIKAGAEVNYRIQLQFAKGFFNRVAQIKNEQKKSTTTAQDFIPQNTKKAVLERTFVQESFQSIGFQLSKTNVTALDEELNTFEVTEATLVRPDATYNQKVRLDFTYLKQTDEVQNVKLITGGRNEFNFGSQKFKRSVMKDKIEEQLVIPE